MAADQKKKTDGKVKWRASPFFRRYPTRLKAGADSRCALSDEHGFAYFRVPKAANTNVMASIYFAVHGHLDVPFQEWLPYKVSFRRPSSLSEEEVERFFKTYTTFSVVRDPATRTLSAYFNKIARQSREKPIVASRLGRPVEQPISFDEFLAFLEDGGRDLNPHWSRQVDLIPVGVERLDYLGRVENLDDDIAAILSSIFGRPLTLKNFNKHGTEATKRATSQLSADDRDRIYRLYDEDYHQLGYPRG